MTTQEPDGDGLRRRNESIKAAQAKVAALPREHRQALENEFQRAEQEARNILRHGAPNNLRYPVPLGTRVKCDVPTRQSPHWRKFQGREGKVSANSRGEVAVELDGSAGAVYWFTPAELVKPE